MQPVAPASVQDFGESKKAGPAISKWVHGVLTDEFFEEFRGGDRAAPAAFANILDISNFASDLLTEEWIHR